MIPHRNTCAVPLAIKWNIHPFLLSVNGIAIAKNIVVSRGCVILSLRSVVILDRGLFV